MPQRVCSRSTSGAMREDACMVSTEKGERREWSESAPEGTRFRVVIAPRGSLLRGNEMSSDFQTVILELLAQTLFALVPRGRSFKLGVLVERDGVERFALKKRFTNESDALAKAQTIRERIRRGDVQIVGS